ncbi:MAG: hypothetical protein M1827_003548 [Pycnora praestabilis]|nr:MAG: hypothetical protein M1827_003548 [Pycnora praestabilis]
MFGRKVRSVSRSQCQYICTSCLLKQTKPPARRHLRYQSSTAAQSSNLEILGRTTLPELDATLITKARHISEIKNTLRRLEKNLEQRERLKADDADPITISSLTAKIESQRVAIQRTVAKKTTSLEASLPAQEEPTLDSPGQTPNPGNVGSAIPVPTAVAQSPLPEEGSKAQIKQRLRRKRQRSKTKSTDKSTEIVDEAAADKRQERRARRASSKPKKEKPTSKRSLKKVDSSLTIKKIEKDFNDDIPTQKALTDHGAKQHFESKRGIKPGTFRRIQDALKKASAKEPEPTINKEIESIEAIQLEIAAIEVDQPPVPSLSYGLERVLFNPGVYHLQDPRSRVYNFDPYLQTIMPAAEFDFNALKSYVTSSRDESLQNIARESGKKYTGSSSSMTNALAHFHFLLSQWREVNVSTLSQGFPDKLRSFTRLQRSPTAIFLRWKGDSYAIDADKEFDSANILMMLGKSMEKLLTLPTDQYERYRKTTPDQISEEERTAPESFHYSTMGDFLMRSQLDAHDARLPGTGMFDLKTRAIVSIRMDTKHYEQGRGYEIKDRFGEWESFEREYFDMIRAAFLKYSLQVRMGRMDGIFVAFHNTERIFGFQYISVPEMDLALHGQSDTTIGDQEFKLSLELLNKVLDRATKKFPEKSLRIHFETRESQTPFMYIFAEPVSEEQVEQIQTNNKAKIDKFERDFLGLDREEAVAEQPAEGTSPKQEWEELQAKVEREMENDELSLGLPKSAENVEVGTLEGSGDGPGLPPGMFEDISLSTSKAGKEGNGQEGLNAAITAEDGEDEGDDDDDENEDDSDSDSDDEEEEEEEEEDEDTDEDEDDEDDEDEDEDLDEDSNDDDDQEDRQAAEQEEENVKAQREGGNGLDADNANELSEQERLALNTGKESDIIRGGKMQSPDLIDSEHNVQKLTEEATLSNSIKRLFDDTDLVSPESNSSNSDTSGDTTFLDEVSKEALSYVPATSSDQLLGMTLTIRNRVNDKYVFRPSNISADDKWSVEYSLAEIPSQARAWSLYGACRMRRKKVLDDGDDEEDVAANYYLRMMRELASKGREWRKEMDQQDQKRVKVVLDQSSSSSSSTEVRKE